MPLHSDRAAFGVSSLPGDHRSLGRTWRPDVFKAAQFPYRDHVWKGRVIVLVDNETFSAAEQFAAPLKEGSNEVGGVVPDVSTGLRWNDGPA